MDKILKEKVCQTLGISTATLDNWNRAGLVPPVPENLNQTDLNKADDKIFSDFIRQIQKNTSNRLHSRANRTSSKTQFTAYQGITDSARKKLLDELIETGRNLPVEVAVVAAAVRQLNCCGLMKPGSRIYKTCQSRVNQLEKKCDDFTVPEKYGNMENLVQHLYDNFQLPNQNDDILGAFYQSLQNVGQKAGGGSFYTPAGALNGIKADINQSVYDPCCGSGNILLNVLTKLHPSNLVYASDIDEIALFICEVNLVLFYNDADMQATLFIKSLMEPVSEKTDEKETGQDFVHRFDLIITNPPWGARFSPAQKKQMKAAYPDLNTSESFSICLYNAFNLLQPLGQLYFFLPQSFLNVATHKKIRKFILEQPGHLEINPLGSVFKGVFSKSILLSFKSNPDFPSPEDLNLQKDYNNISENFYINPEDYSISIGLTSEDRDFLNRIYSLPHITLKGNAKFALGIVTGDNNKYLSTDREALENPFPVFRGKNVHPYTLVPSTPQEYIAFTPNLFQQCAAPELYTQPKIVYRFIYDRPVCAISTQNELLLNSANCFIPTLDYPWETIIALFNSPIYARLYRLRFASLKILRSHLEQLPLPLFTPSQHAKIARLYNVLIKSPENQSLKTDLENLIESLIINC